MEGARSACCGFVLRRRGGRLFRWIRCQGREEILQTIV